MNILEIKKNLDPTKQTIVGIGIYFSSVFIVLSTIIKKIIVSKKKKKSDWECLVGIGPTRNDSD